MDLEDVDGHAAGGGELLVADVALEVLGLLVLHQDRSYHATVLRPPLSSR